VTKINFDGKRAVYVTYVNQTDGSTNTVSGNEIILPGGAINTPKLLLPSGVGPKQDLKNLGIPLILESPDVGAYLYDQHFSIVMVEVPDTIFTPVLVSDGPIIGPI